MLRRSIKARISLTTLAIFVIGIWGLAIFVTKMLRDDIERLIGDQSLSAATSLAAEIDGQLDDRLKALESVAKRITPVMLKDDDVIQRFLEERPSLSVLFNGGSVVTTVDGVAVADVPLSAGRRGVNYADRDYVIGAIKDGKATIGKAVMGKKLRVPVIGMSVPIRDSDGSVIGVLFGAVNLSKSGFLDRLGENHYGKSGGFLLMDLTNNIFVTATDKSRALQPIAAPGVNAIIDRRRQGFFGPLVGINTQGKEVLSSASPIRSAGWIVTITIG